MTSLENTRYVWIRRSLWLFVISVIAVGGGCFVGLRLLGFPGRFAAVFASVLAFEVICLLWLGLILQDNVRQSIANARFQPERLYKRVWLTWGLAGGIVMLERWVIPAGIWFRTMALILAACLLLYGLFSWMLSRLLDAEFSGRLKRGFAERWLPRIPAWMVVSFGLIVMLLFDFLGGIFWWYRNYVTPAQRTAVANRIQMLRAIQLTTLTDRHQRPLGLFEKTESDWSLHYNDPNILSWRVSQVIAEAEGQVHQPAWWWRYLPDGETLQCEPFSIEAFLRVPYYMIKQRRRVGGSTPTLQAAKNVLDFGLKRQGVGFLSTVRQKLFEEMPRSYVMCQAFSPQEMMAIYQSILWAGVGANYGLHRLALYYFGKDDPSALSWNEAVVAAASLPNPGRMNPWYVESCRKGACANKTKARVYEVWLTRIQQIKARLRARGIAVPSELPAFHNGMSKLKAISQDWKHHDLHVRHWTAHLMPPTVQDWKHGSRIQLFYDRHLLTGLPEKPGLIDTIKETLQSYREQLDELQLSFSLVDAKTGTITAQYGGDGHNDMALARKPVMGSMFKVITSLVGDVWPDELPLINHGRSGEHRRRFLYHPTPQQQGHVVRNSHAMPPYVNKLDALAISANIGFVFFSLRWTWFVSPLHWMKILSVGLEQLYVDALKLTPEQAKEKVAQVVRDPALLRQELVKHFGYRPYLQNVREQAIFEAAKAATIQALIQDKDVKKEQLTELLALEKTDTWIGLDDKIKKTFDTHKESYTRRFQTGELSLEILSWARELRMEMGLRYLIALAEHIAGYQRKEDHLVPVMTMTLGVNNTQTQQVAAIAAFLAAKQLRRVAWIHRVNRGQQILYEHRDAVLPLPVSEQAVEKTRIAMRAVLEKGTAKSAGELLRKKYGETIFVNAGAKTGTVQKTRGISCMGFIEHRAGAVTLSTPTNEVLKSYRIRSSLKRRKQRHEKQYRRWMDKYENSSPGSSVARRYRKLALDHQAKLATLEQVMQEAQQVGKKYHQSRKSYKAHYEQAMTAQKRGRQASSIIRRYQNKITRWNRLLVKYQRFRETYQKRLSRLMQADGSIRPPKTRQEIRDMKRYEHWEQQIEKVRGLLQDGKETIKQEQQIQQTKTKEHEEHMAKYRQAVETFRDLAVAFHKTHEPWSLSSSRACHMLFTLLAHWKDWEEKNQPAPTLVTAPATQSPQPNPQQSPSVLSSAKTAENKGTGQHHPTPSQLGESKNSKQPVLLVPGVVPTNPQSTSPTRPTNKPESHTNKGLLNATKQHAEKRPTSNTNTGQPVQLPLATDKTNKVQPSPMPSRPVRNQPIQPRETLPPPPEIRGVSSKE